VAQQAYLTAFQTKDRHRRVTLSEQGLTRFEMIPPRNVNWSAKGQWVHLAKVGFEKYFLRKMRSGQSEPFYESFLLRRLDIAKLKQPAE
jgi:hypothetical protein